MINKLSYLLFSFFIILYVCFDNQSLQNFLKSELGFIEIAQAIFLAISIILLVFLFLKLKRVYGRTQVLLRIGFLSFLLFEEISYFVPRVVPFWVNNNSQNEMNLHNLKIVTNIKSIVPGLEEIVPNNPFSYSLANLDVINFLLLAFILVVTFGSKINILKKFRFFYFKDQSLYWMYVLIAYFLVRILIRFFKGDVFDVPFELMELYIYIILFLDGIIITNSLSKQT